MKVKTYQLTTTSVAKLTVYLLDQSFEMKNVKQRPGILILPGGAYQMCSDREAEPIAAAFLAEGYQAFVLRYTVGPQSKFSQPFADAVNALKFIRQHASQWQVDPQKIAACGFSAGGHLAAMLGTGQEIRPNALVLGYPCILSEMGAVLNYPFPSADQKVDSQTPPTFIFATRDDEVVPIKNSLAFVTALERAAVPFEFHVFAHGRHGLSLARSFTANGLKYYEEPRVAEWFKLAISWLEQLWQPFPANLNYQIEPNASLLELPIGYLWQITANHQALLAALPFLKDEQQRRKVANISLQVMSTYVPKNLSASTLAKLSQVLIRSDKS